MKCPILAAVLLLSAAASAQVTSTYPAGYWERNYVFGGNVGSSYYNLVLRVANLSKASTKVDERMSKAGATLTSLNNNGFWGGGDGGGQRMKSKTMSFSMPDAKAESAVKGLFELGEIQQYNGGHQQGGPATQLDEIKQKLKLVEDELAANAEALKKMPVSSYFLTSQKAKLTQARDAYEAGKNKATLNITLLEAPEMR